LVDDGKDPGALRTIGEVAVALGVRQHVLRYWEQQFPMLRPLKRSGGRRYYRREDVELLTRIDALINREGYTLKGARQAIEKAGGAALEVELPFTSAVSGDTESDERSSVPLSRAGATQSQDDLLSSLKRLRYRLAAALENAPVR
jgi:DNA-binding transcriptional MerR regulator